MIQALIGKKVDQIQMFLQNGRRIPVTEISVSDNAVTQVKTLDKDKYTAVQLGFGVKKKPTKALIGHVKKSGVKTAPVIIRELRVEDEGSLPQVGELITVDAVFKPGDIVKVSGVSKGKGFAGVVKRHNFRGGPKTHGQSDRHRAPGSIGQTTTPGRVYKGKRMAGHMGVENVTVRNLTVVDVDMENKKLLICGLIPGNKNSIVWIERTGENKKFVPLLQEEKETKTEALEQQEAPQIVSEAATEPVEKVKEEAPAQEAKAEGVVEESAAEASSEEVAEKKEEAKEEK